MVRRNLLNASLDTRILMETTSVETVLTYNYFSWVISHIEKRDVSFLTFVYVNNQILHRIYQK